MNATKNTHVITGPYRATKLWNDAVRSFYNGMPLGKHWRGLKQYENCFTASEAIDWFHEKLLNNPNFGSKVSREQTLKLLRKFLKSGLIEEVRGSKPFLDDFKDNKTLYRFCSHSPLRALRTPGSARAPLRTVNKNSNYHNCDYGTSPLLKNKLSANKTIDKSSDDDINRIKIDTIWKSVFIDQLNSYANKLHLSIADGFINTDLVHGSVVRHNVTQVSNRGVVQVPSNDPEDLPDWIISAMKCLAHWPCLIDSSCAIPYYPGVENDIFKIVREFFSAINCPLISSELYGLLLRVYVALEFNDLTLRCPNSSKSEDPFFPSATHSDLRSFDSVEDLMLNMSVCVPHSLDEKSASQYEKLCIGLESNGRYTPFSHRKSEELGFDSADKENHILPELISSRYDCTSNIKKLNVNSDLISLLSYKDLNSYKIPPNSCFETAFTSDNPTTRIIPQKSVDTLHIRNAYFKFHKHAKLRPMSVAVGPLSDHGVRPFRDDFIPKSPKLIYSGVKRLKAVNKTHSSNSINLNKENNQVFSRTNLVQCSNNSDSVPVKSSGGEAIARLKQRGARLSHLRTKSGGFINLGLTGSFDELESLCCKNCSPPILDSKHYSFASLPPMNYLGELSDNFVPFSSPYINCHSVKKANACRMYGHHSGSLAMDSSGSVSSCKSFYSAQSSLSSISPKILTQQGRELAFSVLRFILLLLQPVQRKKLHLLLRMMHKIALNTKLSLESKPVRALMVSTFLRVILRAKCEADYDEVLCGCIVLFLMDNHEEIFQPPKDLAVLVHRKIAQENSERSTTEVYCQQVSDAEYRNQCLTGSQLFLSELLEQILNDKKLANREKKKKLKEFKTLYPEIYKWRFPNETEKKNDKRKLRDLLKFTSSVPVKMLRF